MRLTPWFSLAAIGLWPLAYAGSAIVADTSIPCDACEHWNTPRAPFRVFGDTFYVGVQGLSVLAIGTPEGVILLDGGLPQSAPLIADNLRAVGLDPGDIRYILNSHAHFDHAGGIAALQRASGAVVVASAEGVKALSAGLPLPEDPQAGFGAEENRFPPVGATRVVADRETVSLGGVTVTAHLTPGHTPGGTTWAWRACEGERCLDLVFADSLNPVSAPGFRFTGGDGRPSIVGEMRGSIDRVAGLPCDVLIAVHPGFSGMDKKVKRRKPRLGIDPLIDDDACREYAADALDRLERRITEEQLDGAHNTK